MADLVINWLRRVPRWSFPSPTIGTTWVKVQPANPQRYQIVICSDPVATLYWWINDTAPWGNGATLPPASPPMIISEDDWGGAATWSLWMKSSADPTYPVVMSLHYQSHEYEIYRRLQHELIPGTESFRAYP